MAFQLSDENFPGTSDMKSLIVMLCLAALPAYAQPCRGIYLLGETVPAACKYDHRDGIPEYQRWDKYHKAMLTPPAPEPTRPSFGSYNNSLYGFGR
jgi:hypothetical protein